MLIAPVSLLDTWILFSLKSSLPYPEVSSVSEINACLLFRISLLTLTFIIPFWASISIISEFCILEITPPCDVSGDIWTTVNTDPEAPFFKAADYGIIGDAFEVVPKLIEEIKKFRNN